MPTRRSQETLKLIRSHKKAAMGVGAEWLMRVNPNADTVAKLRMGGTRADPVRGLGMPALMLTPRKLEIADGAILHLHGGAFVSGGILQCRAIASPICAAAKTKTMTFSYRLAPRHPHPAQLEDAMKAYRYLLDLGYAPERIALVGESAGGNLALALALKLRDAGKPMPAAIALMSPWVDLAQKGSSYVELADVDATLDAESLMESAVAYAGNPARLSDPEISPVYADFNGFPPTLIHCGASEILLSDSEMLEAKLLEAGVDAQIVRWAGMCHVFQVFGFEESKASNRQIGAFLARALREGKMDED